MQTTMITNVNLVENHFLQQDLWRNTSTQFMKGQKDFKCESCGKSFSQTGDLKRHINTIHEGHKDYKCESCGR